MPKRKAPTKKRGSKKTGSRGRRGKSNVISVDFTDVEAGGGMPTPDGYYVGEIMSAEMEASAAGNDMITVRWKTNIGSTVFDRFVLVPQSLWVLRTALNCMGYDTPDGPFDFDPDELIGNKCGLEIQNEEYPTQFSMPPSSSIRSPTCKTSVWRRCCASRVRAEMKRSPSVTGVSSPAC